MNIIKILMTRDGLTKAEAEELVAETKEEIQAAIDRGEENTVEDIVADYLGLELDYIFDLI